MNNHSSCIYSKNFKVEIENQLKKRIKNVRSDRGDEYNDTYDGSGKQRLRLFTKFLKECGIVPQYAILGSPTMNGIFFSFLFSFEI